MRLARTLGLAAGVGHTPVHGTEGPAVRFRRPVVLPDVPVELLDGPFDAVALARARALGLDVVELVKMRGNRRLLRAGLPPRSGGRFVWAQRPASPPSS